MEDNQRLEELLSKTQAQMNEHRFRHTLGVRDTAVQLAQRFRISSGQAAIAGILHDYCKYWSRERMEAVILSSTTTPQSILDEPLALWHSHVAADILPEECGIEDEEVLQAIRYHTTGHPGMTPLEMVIFLADYIEPGRDFDGVEKIRQIAEVNLENAVLAALKNTLLYLLKKNQQIHPETLLAYNYYLRKQMSEVEV
ncbi:bis(5'-nucleosyl)-tetraphosphatase (symmetrical) YqeK [Rubeoparvulum massiliense]|uniref:bis(5'-nucleosyl)-tetraphosphatase (symmetrical) YqeK n=1 Tax=Rubeoparvulum massiliense TaxID=1631346 RepID=UPI00065E2E33|nr:bis(5'-nucleosyl)-tetraphosphatase (symmetrical) YqeK [Rubeoparvulum massiliense]